ncbi:MAG: hypothetical protein D3916_07185 [Candidatus Electrothrix sp. MAN1_4]|nr:hypothetical protein [Candidatus Electrothrix sp. MAN1_4]
MNCIIPIFGFCNFFCFFQKNLEAYIEYPEGNGGAGIMHKLFKALWNVTFSPYSEKFGLRLLPHQWFLRW